MPALDDHFSKIYRQISGPGIINDRLIIVIFMGEGGIKKKNETSASAFRRRVVPEPFAKACGWAREGGHIFEDFMWTS